MTDKPPFDAAGAWDSLVSHGLSEKEATRHVMLMIANQPEAVRQQYLKDIDPGKLASFGLGAADMMSFGLGDKFATRIEGQEATDTQQAAQANHPTAHLLGEVAGLVGPAAAEYGLAKAGVLVPTAVGRAVRAITSKPGRAVAKTAVNALAGAGYGAAQAAGHAEPGHALEAAGRAAPIGAAVGALLPWTVGGLLFGKRLAGRVAGPVADFVAGEGPAVAPKLAGPQHFAGGVLDDIAQASADRQAQRISAEDYNTAMEMARRQMHPPTLLEPQAPAPSLLPEAVPAKGRPGHPVWRGDAAPTRSVRTEPLTPSVEPADPMRALLRKQSASKLRATLAKPETPSAVRQLIQVELKRRRG